MHQRRGTDRRHLPLTPIPRPEPGDPTPPKEDIEITRRLREDGDIMGVGVLDHIVAGKSSYVSFVDDGYW